MSITRIFRRLPELHDGSHQNEATAMLVDPFLRGTSEVARTIDARALFEKHWSILARTYRAHQKQGVAILGFDEGKDALAQAWLAASLDRPRAAIIGRHSMCGVALPSRHEATALRHLAVLVRATSLTGVRVRVIDLHTQAGFSDESGRVLQSITADGSVFLRAGDAVFAILATEDGEPAADAAVQYATIPERIFVEEREGTSGAERRFESVRALRKISSSSTIVRSKLGAIAAAGELRDTDERVFGTLLVRGAGGGLRREVGASILERGLLVGRYTRCEVGSSDSGDGKLSRVHALIVKDGDDVLAIDTASSNGISHHGKSVLLHVLEDGDTLDLGGELELTWHRES